MRIGKEAVTADHNMSFIRGVRGHPGDKFQVFHRLCLRAVLSVLIELLLISLTLVTPLAINPPRNDPPP
jgi:hypothetical protein